MTHDAKKCNTQVTSDETNNKQMQQKKLKKQHATNKQLNATTEQTSSAHPTMFTCGSKPMSPKVCLSTAMRTSDATNNNTITDGGVAPQCTFARPT